MLKVDFVVMLVCWFTTKMPDSVYFFIEIGILNKKDLLGNKTTKQIKFCNSMVLNLIMSKEIINLS